MRVRQRPKSFESSAEVLQFASFTNAPHERFSGDCDDGLQQAYGRLRQLIEGLFRGRKQTLKLGDGGLSRLTLGPEGLVAADDVIPSPVGFFRYCRRERTGGEPLALRLRLDERQPFDLEGLAGYPDRALEVAIYLLRSSEALPEEAVALSRMLVVVPAP